MNRTFSVSVVLLACVLGGCLMPNNGPRPGETVATGQPLAVVDDVKVATR